MLRLMMAIVAVGFLAVPAEAQQKARSCGEYCSQRCSVAAGGSSRSLCESRCNSACIAQHGKKKK
jgi:hypothetical protein